MSIKLILENWRKFTEGLKPGFPMSDERSAKAPPGYYEDDREFDYEEDEDEFEDEDYDDYDMDDLEESYFYISDASYEDGSVVEEDLEFWDDVVVEAEYRGRKVKLNKPMRGDVKKFKVYVKDPKTKNVKKVNFGDKNMRIKKSNPKRRKSFRARHNCDNPGPKTKARYWSCRKW